MSAKRLMDAVGAVVLLVVLAPLMAMLLTLVAASGGNPIYGHERIGLDGRRFRCWKIRTMAPDAEGRLAGLLWADPALAAEWARDHKLRDDPRVTRIGRLLRRSSLDETPQLWNILVGDMSLVGPRPITAAEVGKYGPSARHYFAVRPGLTGLWQLEGRNDIPYSRRVVLDRVYVTRRTLRGDVALMLKTPVAVLRRTGR